MPDDNISGSFPPGFRPHVESKKQWEERMELKAQAAAANPAPDKNQGLDATVLQTNYQEIQSPELPKEAMDMPSVTPPPSPAQPQTVVTPQTAPTPTTIANTIQAGVEVAQTAANIVQNNIEPSVQQITETTNLVNDIMGLNN